MKRHHLRLMHDAAPSVDDTEIPYGEYFKRLFDGGPAACIITDSACRVVDANRAAEVILLWPLALMRERPFQHMIGVSDRDIFNTMAADMLLNAFEPSRPLCMKPQTGEDIDVLFKATTFRSADGTPEFISWIFLETPSSGSADLV